MMLELESDVKIFYEYSNFGLKTFDSIKFKEAVRKGDKSKEVSSFLEL